MIGKLFRAACEKGVLSSGSKLCLPRRGYSTGKTHGEGVTYEGVTLYPPSKWHTYAGEGMAGLMWFWIFVRAYHDGSTLLVSTMELLQ